MKFSERIASREVRKWADITSDPLWYHKLGKERLLFANPREMRALPRIVSAVALARTKVRLEGRAATKPSPQHSLYLVFEELLSTERVRLGSLQEGCYDWDSERQPLDKIVIHHSKSPVPMRSHYNSAMGLLRIYSDTYNYPDEADKKRPGVVGKPIYSGHYDRDKVQGFWPYHWMVTPEGTATRYLGDQQTGWQAGAWAVNCSSVSICLDADLTDRSPDIQQLEGVAHTIEQHYGDINIGPDTIIGHNEVRAGVSCPGDQFMPAWKGQLLSLMGS